MKSRYFRVTPIIIIGITYFPLRYVHTVSYVHKKRNPIAVRQRGA